MRHQTTKLDQILGALDHWLKTTTVPATNSQRPSPANEQPEATLSKQDQQHVAGLMRVDHTGEVCAQALYRGQAAVAKTQAARDHLNHAAAEEYDHLAWCQQRLTELEAKTSHLNAFWYLGSFTIGATAGMVSDAISYGFVVETEHQVMKHLDQHLKQLPCQDQKSRAILQQMYQDESEHAHSAQVAGGKRLPLPVRLIMKAQSKVMTTIAYRW